ncbi:MAG: RNA polymerase sigma factor [Bacteroidota bacterium]
MEPSSAKSDIALIKQFVRTQDEQAFVALVNRYKDLALSVAISVLKDKTWAEDAVQESFVKVYHSLPSLRRKAHFKTWLYRIVINTCYNERKRRRVTMEYGETTELVSSIPPQQNKLREEDQKRYIQLALEQLKPDEALVLRMFYLLELRIKEIERATGFSKAKIKVDLHRGRQNLSQILRTLLGSEIEDLL